MHAVAGKAQTDRDLKVMERRSSELSQVTGKLTTSRNARTTDRGEGIDAEASITISRFVRILGDHYGDGMGTKTGRQIM